MMDAINEAVMNSRLDILINLHKNIKLLNYNTNKHIYKYSIGI